jgi:glycosyltransferase involved in cell wall biosynthesis
MNIFVTGTRGIPDIPGGVEKHCEELYPRIASGGHKVFIGTRRCYATTKLRRWKGVDLVHVFAPRKKSIEALAHTFLCLLKARACHPDVIHIHAIGPSLLAPLARLMGFRVIITNHGPEYDRQKWNKLAKVVLKVSEKMGGIWAHEVIAVSAVVRGIIRQRCHRDANVIPNGVNLPKRSRNTDYLDNIGATSGKYALAVARFVPEKGLHDLIDAFKKFPVDWTLVIAGDADHETAYSRKLRQMASGDERIILTGYITGEPLNQIYSHAGLFVLPSYHEGLPIALLEAMSYGIPVLVSDIPANKEIKLPAERYFRCGDVTDLREKMIFLLEKGLSKKEREDMLNEITTKYNWDKIAEKTIGVYERAIR